MRKNNKSNKARRVLSTNTKRRLPSRSFSLGLRPYEDRRLFHPLGASAPAASFNRPCHRLVIGHASVQPSSRPNSSRISHTRPIAIGRIAFDAPSRVLVCVRRKQRAEVLHALGHTGKGGQRKPKFSEYSSIQC